MQKRLVGGWLVVSLPSLVACSQAPARPAPDAEPAATSAAERAATSAAERAVTSAAEPATATAPAVRASGPAPGRSPAAAPPALRVAMLEARQSEATDEHRVRVLPAGLRVEVAEQQVGATFDARGASVRGLAGEPVQGRLSLASVGRAGGTRQAVAAAKPAASGHSVRWEHPVAGGSVQETWQAGPLGLEHRVLVRQKPAGQGAVELEVAVAGMRAEADGERVTLRGDRGALAMSDYFVRDARGKLLAGAMSVRDGRVVYRYEDEGAVYPVEVDPLVWTQQARLLASGKFANDYFGVSMSLSADGSTALISDYGKVDEASEESNGGSVYVFVRAGVGWSQQARLFASDKTSSDYFGNSVSLSADGSTALIGAYGVSDSGKAQDGAAYVFVRTGSGWSQQQKLLGANKDKGDSFGRSVSLSSDGETALVSAPYESDGGMQQNGAAYVFTRMTTTWSLSSKLTASDGASLDRFGQRVSLAGDAKTALVGAAEKSDGGNYGAAYVFVRAGSGWKQQARLAADDKAFGDYFGSAVSLSSDGSTALVGAGDRSEGDTLNSGAAYVLTRVGSTWSQQAKLLASDRAKEDFLGLYAASLSADGSLALVGSYRKSSGGTTQDGAAYVFARTGVSWSQQSKLTSQALDGQFGSSVSLSADGKTLLVGAVNESNGGAKSSGAAYVFVPAKGQGDACSTSADCGSSLCVDGVCCDTACDAGVCDACSKAAGAPTDGTCALLTGPVCDDGNACTTGDSCQAGACKPGAEAPCTPPECQEKSSCVPASGECLFISKPDGTPCAAGVCQQGSCQETAGVGGGSGASGQSGAAGTTAGGASGQSGAAGKGGSGASGSAGKGGAGSSGAAGKGDSGTGGTAGKGGSGTGGAGGAGTAPGGAAGTSGGGAVSGSSGQTGVDATTPEDDGGCGCRAAGRAGGQGAWGLAALAVGLGARRRRRVG